MDITTGQLTYIYTESNITVNASNTISRHREAVAYNPINNTVIGIINELTSDLNGQNGTYTAHFLEIIDVTTGSVVNEIEVPASLNVGNNEIVGGGL